MRALVTGSAGFLGRHLVPVLERAGYDVTGIDVQPGYRTALRDARGYFRQASERYDLAVHCAAAGGGRAAVEGDPLAGAVNLEVDAGFFRWAARTRPGRAVYLSSAAAYPVDIQRHPRPLKEADIRLQDPWLPDCLDGWCRLTGETLAYHLRREGVPVTVARLFSVYGPGQARAFPVAAFAARAQARLDPFEVWGNGQQARDFIHVDDVTATIAMCVEDDIEGPLNVGTGRATTMDELAYMICQQAGYRPVLEHHPAAPAGPPYRVADITLLGKVRQPEITLEDGIRRAFT